MYKTLVLSAGGVRGIAFAGALHELDRLGILDLASIDLFVGTSIGAFVACLLAVGYAPSDLVALAHEIRIDELVTVNVATLIQQWGMDDGAKLKAYIGGKIEARMGDPAATMGQLVRQKGRDLRVCSSNLTLNEATYFSGATHPDMCIVDAVCMSLALPPVFAPVRHAGQLYTDGAFLDSFPLRGLDPTTTLGVKLCWGVAFNLMSIEQYFSRIAFCCLNYAEQNHSGTPGIHVIPVHVGDVSTVNFTLPLWGRQQLVQDGRRAVVRWAESLFGQDRVDLCQLNGDVEHDKDEDPKEEDPGTGCGRCCAPHALGEAHKRHGGGGGRHGGAPANSESLDGDP